MLLRQEAKLSSQVHQVVCPGWWLVANPLNLYGFQEFLHRLLGMEHTGGVQAPFQAGGGHLQVHVAHAKPFLSFWFHNCILP